jgi:sodium transport system permease protein
MNLKSVNVVFKKELKDLFRDKKTVIVSILLPLIIFPVMYGLMGRGIDSTNKKVESNLKIAISGETNQTLNKLISEQKNVTVIKSADMKKDVQDGKIYLGLIIPDNFEKDISNEKNVGIKVIYDDTSQSSMIAKDKISFMLDTYSKEIIKNRLVKRNMDISILNPINITEQTAAKEKGGEGKVLLAMMIPLFLVIYALSSPMAAAIDLGAGEKERGTLEPLLTTQASRLSLLFGKLFAITVMGLLGTVSSMVGLVISFQVSGSMFGGASSAIIAPSALLIIGVSTVLVTMIFGAVELSVSIYARSFKEAQTYLSPFSIIGIIAVFGTMNIDIKDVPLVLFNIPIANLSIIMKEVIMGIYNPLHLAITFGWTVVYIGGAILFARHMFSREEVIFRT